MAGAQIIVKGVPKTNRELRAYGERIQNPRKALNRIGEYMRGLSHQAFKDSRDPSTGQPWKRLSPVTIENRRNKDKGRIKILVDSSTLRNSIRKMIVGKQSVAVGTNDVKAGTHQFGNPNAKWGKNPVSIPARPFLGVDSRGMDVIERIMRKFLETGA